MKNTLLASFAAISLMAAAVPAFAQSETTTTSSSWTDDQGQQITKYSTTQNYAPVTDPALTPSVGVALPETVKVYPLPPTIHVANPDMYSYTIVNNHPVVVERTTRKIVHTWD